MADWSRAKLTEIQRKALDAVVDYHIAHEAKGTPIGQVILEGKAGEASQYRATAMWLARAGLVEAAGIAPNYTLHPTWLGLLLSSKGGVIELVLNKLLVFYKNRIESQKMDFKKFTLDEVITAKVIGNKTATFLLHAAIDAFDLASDLRSGGGPDPWAEWSPARDFVDFRSYKGIRDLQLRVQRRRDPPKLEIRTAAEPAETPMAESRNDERTVSASAEKTASQSDGVDQVERLTNYFRRNRMLGSLIFVCVALGAAAVLVNNVMSAKDHFSKRTIPAAAPAAVASNGTEKSDKARQPIPAVPMPRCKGGISQTVAAELSAYFIMMLDCSREIDYGVVETKSSEPSEHSDANGDKAPIREALLISIEPNQIKRISLGKFSLPYDFQKGQSHVAMEVSPTTVRVFLHYKERRNSWAETGKVFVVDRREFSLRTEMTLFKDENWGWFPQFKQGDVIHFSFDGKWRMRNTTRVRKDTYVDMENEFIGSVYIQSGNLLPGLTDTVIAALREHPPAAVPWAGSSNP